MLSGASISACDPSTNPPYCYKELMTEPLVAGIVRMWQIGEPHYHAMAECLYITAGTGKTWSKDNKWEDIKAGDWIEYKGNEIHETKPNPPLDIFYWYHADHTYDAS